MTSRLAFILFACSMVACGGQQSTAVAGVCQTSPFPAVGGQPAWSCTSSSTDALQILPACPTNVQAGGSPCDFVGTVDTTTDPSHPTNLSIIGQCFACGASGHGTEWRCSSQGWQATDTFSCGR